MEPDYNSALWDAELWRMIVGDQVSVQLRNGRADGIVDEVRELDDGGILVFLRPDRETARDVRIVFDAGKAQDIHFFEAAGEL